MLKDYLAYDEQQALESICRFHNVDDSELIKHLAEFCNWTRADEAAKGHLGGDSPPFLIVLLSQLGIYGGAALAKAREK